jgi:plasmid maintenance system antidote protein VapI
MSTEFDVLSTCQAECRESIIRSREQSCVPLPRPKCQTDMAARELYRKSSGMISEPGRAEPTILFKSPSCLPHSPGLMVTCILQLPVPCKGVDIAKPNCCVEPLHDDLLNSCMQRCFWVSPPALAWCLGCHKSQIAQLVTTTRELSETGMVTRLGNRLCGKCYQMFLCRDSRSTNLKMTEPIYVWEFRQPRDLGGGMDNVKLRGMTMKLKPFLKFSVRGICHVLSI